MEWVLNNSLPLGGLLFVCTLLAGFWLLKTGKPYRNGIFNLHKLVALATSILGIFTIGAVGWIRQISRDMENGLLVIACGLILILFASGTMLSIGKPQHKVIVIAHRIASGLAVVVAGLILYLKLTNP